MSGKTPLAADPMDTPKANPIKHDTFDDIRGILIASNLSWRGEKRILKYIESKHSKVLELEKYIADFERDFNADQRRQLWEAQRTTTNAKELTHRQGAKKWP